MDNIRGQRETDAFSQKPIAVLISDIHFSLGTLSLAEKALNKAIDKANELDVPLIVAGDIHDTKANLRGECIAAMIKCFKRCRTMPIVLVGNHDKINEKSEEHSLEFLRDIVKIVDKPEYIAVLDNEHEKIDVGYCIPYFHDVEKLREYMKTIPKGSRIIMHQGIEGSNAGHYYKDPSALSLNDVNDFRVISGHYHRRQDIRTGRPRKGAVGLFSYIGNPYTLNFGEATDPDKGFQILMEDGLLEFVSTKIRYHKIIEIELGKPFKFVVEPHPLNLYWLKVKGTSEQLAKFDDTEWRTLFKNLRIELIPTDSGGTNCDNVKENMSQSEIIDSLIESGNFSDDQKERLKTLFRTIGS